MVKLPEISEINVNGLIDSLENGFTFTINITKKNYKLSAKGKYLSPEKYTFDGTFSSEGKVEPVNGINPMETIRMVTGERDFKPLGEKGGSYFFKFTANLFLVDPINGTGEGKIEVKHNRIVSIKGKTKNGVLSIYLKPLRYNSIAKYSIIFNGTSLELVQRLKIYGEKDITKKFNTINFIESRTFDKRLLQRGNLVFMSMISDLQGLYTPVGNSISRFSKKSEITFNIQGVKRGYDSRGRPSLILHAKNVPDTFIGMFVDGEFSSLSYGNTIMYFPYKDTLTRDIIYAIIKSGPLRCKIKEIKRRNL